MSLTVSYTEDGSFFFCERVHFDFLGTFPHEQEKIYILVDMACVLCLTGILCRVHSVISLC